MSVRMRVSWHGHGMLLPLPVRMWEAADRVEMIRLLQHCNIVVAKAIATHTRSWVVKWVDPRCVGWFLYEFEFRKVLGILAREGLVEKRG